MGGKACWQALETDGCGLQPSLAMNLWALKSFRHKHKKLFSTLKPYATPPPSQALTWIPGLSSVKYELWTRRSFGDLTLAIASIMIYSHSGLWLIVRGQAKGPSHRLKPVGEGQPPVVSSLLGEQRSGTPRRDGGLRKGRREGLFFGS